MTISQSITNSITESQNQIIGFSLIPQNEVITTSSTSLCSAIRRMCCCCC